MDIVIALLVGAAGSLIAAELSAHASLFGRWLIDRAVMRLPEHERARYREEWHAHFDELPGPFGKLMHALSCIVAGRKIAKALRPLDPKTARKVFKWTIAIMLSPSLARDVVRGVARGDFRAAKVRLLFFDCFAGLFTEVILKCENRHASNAEISSAVLRMVQWVTKLLEQIKSDPDAFVDRFKKFTNQIVSDPKFIDELRKKYPDPERFAQQLPTRVVELILDLTIELFKKEHEAENQST